MFGRSKEWRKCLAELNEEQRNKLNKIFEENLAYQREYAKKYWEQQRDKELKEYMKKYTNKTFRIKNLFRKKEILYTTYPMRNKNFILPSGLYDQTMAEIVNNLRISILTMELTSIKIIFYNDKKYNDMCRCKKHERMLRYMRSKYPITY